MTFNQLLRESAIDPATVLLLRHTGDQYKGRAYRKFNPAELSRLAVERPDLYNAYQQAQQRDVESQILNAKFVGSFIGHQAKQARFVGIYENKGSKPITRDEFWAIPANIELRELGMMGWGEDDARETLLWFDLAPTLSLRHLNGKLVVAWPVVRSWHRFAHRFEPTIITGHGEVHSGAALTPRPLIDDVDDAPPDRVLTSCYRILRDTPKALAVKRLHNFECQVCGMTLNLPTGGRYAEAHHIRPLGGGHQGPDQMVNILCICPNHHAELDYAVSEISLESLRKAEGHNVGKEFVDYHNRRVAELRATGRDLNEKE